MSILGVVRKQLNLAFEGQSFADPLVIGDLEIKGIQGNVCMLLCVYFFHLLTPMSSTGISGET